MVYWEIVLILSVQVLVSNITPTSMALSTQSYKQTLHG